MITSFPKKVEQVLSVEDLVLKIGNAEMHGLLEEKLIYSVSAPENAENGTMVFLNKKAGELARAIENSNASIFVVSKNVIDSVNANKILVVTEDPLAWFILALQELMATPYDFTISDQAKIDRTAQLANNVSIGAGSTIEKGCVIGEGTVIGKNTVIARDSHIGENCFIESNVTIGSIGLGYHKDFEGNRLFFPHLGRVVLGNSVVIGAGSVIVRGQLTDTILRDWVRLGNLVNIGHNVVIGRHSVISSSSCIAGGAAVGEHCNIAAGVNINSKISIGNGASIGLGSVVTKDIQPNKKYFGNPARPLPTIKNF